MPNLTVSSNVDTMLGAADNAAILSSIGLGSTNSPSFSSINTTDRVGIGTTSPSSRLHVAFPTSLTGLNLVSDAATSVSNFVTWSTAWGSLSGGIKSGPDNGWTTQIYSNQQLSFSAGGVDSSDLLISAAGNVGIGTNAPTSKLHVAGGNILVDNYIQGQRVFSFMGSSTYAGMDTAGMFTNTGVIGFSANTSVNFTNSCDTFLLRDGADNTLALRNGASVPQTFRVYNTFLGTTANEWFEIDWKTSPGTVRLFTMHGGTGVARNIDISAGGTLYFGAGTSSPIRMYSSGVERWNISAAGHFITAADNQYDIGASGANRPRNIYMGNSLTTGSIAPNSGADLIFNGASTGAAWKITPPGHFHAFADNAYDIGASNANRPRNFYLSGFAVVGSSLSVGGDLTVGDTKLLGWISGRSIMSSPADGYIRFTDSFQTNFNRLQFGGTSASFPALKRVGTDLQVVVANTAAAINVAAGDADLTFIEDRYRRKGSGTPEGAVTAPIGAVYHNTTGGAGTSFYVKESGTGNTGWVGK